MAFIDRIGVDFGRTVAVEEAVRIAAAHEVRYIDCQMDIGPNALEASMRPGARGCARPAPLMASTLGLHTLSAVNIAEVSPFVRTRWTGTSTPTSTSRRACRRRGS